MTTFEWQPIDAENPPRMVTVLLWRGFYGSNGELANWHMATGYRAHAIGENCMDWVFDGRQLKIWDAPPERWMPLPEPPK